MRRLFISAALICFCAVEAQAAQVRFQGEFFFTGANAPCGMDNPTGSNGRVRFRPVIPGTDNGPTASISFYSPRSTDSFKAATVGNFTTTAFKAVRAVSTADDWSTYNNASIKFLTLTTIPAGGITANTILSGQISRWKSLWVALQTSKPLLRADWNNPR
jgi:hypothetical protein